jgi:hypothetical protein
MTRNLKKLLSVVAMAGFLGGAGCLGNAPTSPNNTTPNNTSNPSDPNAPAPVANDPTDPSNSNNTSGGDGNTFDHMMDDNVDPFQVLSRIQEEGPPEFSTRMHSCGKMKYATLRNVLANIGVDMAQTGATTPLGLYNSGAGALGRPDYANRISEATALSTAGAVRLYDIFVAAAPRVISQMPMNARCNVAGVATTMFDTAGTACTKEGIACLTGAPASQAQVDLCSAALASNTTDKIGTTTVTVGQVIAVAALLSAAHSCE